MSDQIPDCVPLEQWADFVEYRLTEVGRKKFGPVAQKRMLKKLARLHAAGYDVVELLDHAMQAGWLDVYPNKDYRRAKRPGYHRNTRDLGPPATTLAVDREKGRDALKTVLKAIK